MSASFIREWAKAQQPKGPSMKSASVFYRNLEEELDVRRAQYGCSMLHQKDTTIDFSSCDVLSLGSSGSLRTAFLDELAQHPAFQLGSHGSRLLDGNMNYLEMLEREIAEFHGVESALVVNSGGAANESIFSVIPRPGDAIVYDELIHATVHDGMKQSLVLCQKPFRHNDVDSFIDTLIDVRDSQPQIRNGTRSVIVSVEGVYSMDGDVCPLQELIEAAKEIFPNGNAQFVIDEAHSGGVIGPNGGGLVSALGLGKEVAIRMHTFGKALAGSGAVILSNNTVRSMLLNYAKPIMYSIAPAFPMLAATRAGYKLLKADKTQQARDRMQRLVKLFMETITSSPIWDRANDAGILRIPLYEEEDWESRPFVAPICPVWTRPKHNFYLSFHLHLAGFAAYPISFPVVPKGADRVRLIFHASNTEDQVKELAESIRTWAEEMLEIEEGGDGVRLPTSARQAFNLMMKESSNGCG